MKIFNYENYDDHYVMHCKTEEDAKIFMRYLRNVGASWSGGDSYSENDTRWNIMREKTCYRFRKGVYDSIDFYQDDEATKDALGYSCFVLEFDEFDWSKSDIVFSFDSFFAGIKE